MNKKLRNFLVIVFGLTFICLILGWLAGLSPGIVYSDGHRSGVVYKFSKKGIMYKTWEGELSLGLNETDSDGSLIPRVFTFSVSSDEIAKKIDEAERSGKRVSLHYREYIGRGSYYGATEYDILDVE